MQPQNSVLSVKGSFIFGLLSALVVSAACGGSASDAGGGGHPAAETGKVKGVAMDTQNRPLSGAKIDVCSSVFWESCVSGSTGSDGSYSLSLTPTNVWRAYGSVTRSYDGKAFCLELAVDNDSTFASNEATIRNFSWKMSGLKPGMNANGYASSYFGATLSVVLSGTVFLDQHRVRLNFVPNGQLIDGSTGTAFSVIVGDWASNAIGNIPVGLYTVTAEYIQGSGSVPLRIATDSSGRYGASAVVHFTPDSSSCLIAPEAAVYVQP